MDVSLNSILALVGRIDDATGFDAPRERFRRFLAEYVTDAGIARSFIEQVQHSLNDQHRRALQDLVVLLGRFLGFETTFGGSPRPGHVKHDGQWRGHPQLDIDVQVRTDQAAQPVPPDAYRSLQLAASRAVESRIRHLTLVVVTPLHAARTAFDEAAATDKLDDGARVVSVRSLLWLADVVSSGRFSREEVVQLLTAGSDLDIVVDLMSRLTAKPQKQEPSIEPELPAPAVSEHGYWIMTIEPDEHVSPEQIVRAVIRRRHLLAIRDTGLDLPVRAGDWTCFAVQGKGILGHAQVDAIADPAGLVRNAEQYRAVLQLTDVEIYDTPVALPEPVPALVKDEHARGEGGEPILTSLSREQFAGLTVRHHENRAEDLRHAG